MNPGGKEQVIGGALIILGVMALFIWFSYYAFPPSPTPIPSYNTAVRTPTPTPDLGQQIYSNSDNPAQKIPESNPFQSTAPNPFADNYENPFQ